MLNSYDFYIPIDIRGAIKSSSKTNIQQYANKSCVMLFQLFDGCRPLMLDDATSVTIAFTNTNNVSVKGNGELQIVNPHRGTISYVLSKDDITMSGLHTVTIGIMNGQSFFTVQSVIYCQDISDSLYNALTEGTDGSDSGSYKYTQWGTEFPCSYYNEYCRICRRCMWVWYHNTYPKPLCFDEIKMCKNPFVTPPTINYANLPNEYVKADYPTMINDDGYLVICIDNVHYVCDIGRENAIYLLDKDQPTPEALVGLYLGSKLIPYYKISEKLI